MARGRKILFRRLFSKITIQFLHQLRSPINIGEKSEGKSWHSSPQDLQTYDDFLKITFFGKKKHLELQIEQLIFFWNDGPHSELWMDRKLTTGGQQTYAVFTLGIFTAVTEFTYLGKFLVNVNIN